MISQCDSTFATIVKMYRFVHKYPWCKFGIGSHSALIRKKFSFPVVANWLKNNLTQSRTPDLNECDIFRFNPHQSGTINPRKSDLPESDCKLGSDNSEKNES